MMHLLLEKTEFFIFMKNVYAYRNWGTKKNGGQAVLAHRCPIFILHIENDKK